MDDRSLKNFMNAHTGGLLYYVKSFGLTVEEAEEIVSDVFLELWQNKGKAEDIQNLKAWLVTVAHNKTISHLRKKECQARIVSWDEMEYFVMPSDWQTADEQIISREEMEKINRIIKSLSPRCRQCFVLAKEEEMPYKEIANLLGLSVNTVNNHIANALKQIAEALDKAAGNK